MKKVYLICDSVYNPKDTYVSDWSSTVEYHKMCHGRVVDENGIMLGQHCSSSFSFLRRDLASKVNRAEVEIVDLIGKPAEVLELVATWRNKA